LPTTDKNAEFGLKYSDDPGKLDWSLLPWDAIEEVLKTLDYGATKYEPRNWEKGNSFNEYYSAAMRHIQAWYAGNDYDEGESELHHLAQASFNILALLAFQMRGIGEDDRPKYKHDKNFKSISTAELKAKAQDYKTKRNTK
jgi:hypothetical protein